MDEIFVFDKGKGNLNAVKISSVKRISSQNGFIHRRWISQKGWLSMGNKLKNFTDKVWYGTGAVGLDLSYGMFYEKLNMYLTDILGLNTNYLLGLTAVSRIWDGVNDPMMGSIVDNTNTKFGRYRPWVVIGACLNAVILFLIFFNPGFSTEKPGIGL